MKKKKSKKIKLGLFWLRVVGLIILGLGLLARNTIVLLIGIVLLLLGWQMERRGVGKVNKRRVNKRVNKVNKRGKRKVNDEEIRNEKLEIRGDDDDDGDGGPSDEVNKVEKLIICEDYDEMSKKAAGIVLEQLKKKPNSVLGLATGSTTMGMYMELIGAYKRGEIDFSQVMTFNLDDYYKISRDNEQSFWREMRKDFFDGVNIKDENINIPNCQGDDYRSFCREYEEKIKAVGGIDLQVLGIGRNGHIGFNEPGSSFDSRTRKVGLTESTISANSRHFRDESEVPREAITMGLGTIMEARKIILVANGEGKAEAVAGAARGFVSEDVPASVLQKHSDVTFILEREAAIKI